MAQRTTKLVCGTCGSTGRVFRGRNVKVCIDCNGVGYSEVLHEDEQTTDRHRETRQRAALRRFTFFLALLAGAAVSYAVLPKLDDPILAVYFVLATWIAYLFLRLPWLAAVLRPLMNFLKVFVGFVVFATFIVVVCYLLFRLREAGGW